MSLLKRGRVYWFQFFVDSVRYARSTGTSNRRQAEKIEQQFRSDLNLRRNQVAMPKPDMTVGEASARFLANNQPKHWQVDRLKAILPYWSEIQIGRIHKGVSDDYRRHRHSQKAVSDATINRDLQLLRHLLYWVVEQGWLTSNPLSRLRLMPERRKPRRVLSVAEEQKLLSVAAKHLQAIVVTALDTGMRRGELLKQRWEDIEFNRKMLFVTQSKTPGGEGREIPLTERVHALLLALRRPKGLVFTFRDLPIHAVKRAWKTAMRRSELPYRRFHDLRHTFNTRLMEAGVMQEVRMALMGHSSGQGVNSVYTHIELPAKRTAIRKLEAWLETQVPDPGEVPEATNTNARKEEQNE